MEKYIVAPYKEHGNPAECGGFPAAEVPTFHEAVLLATAESTWENGVDTVYIYLGEKFLIRLESKEQADMLGMFAKER